MTDNRSILKRLDWTTIVLYLVLVVMGWLNLYGAIYDYDQSSIFDFSNRAGKQFVWIITACVIAIVLLVVDTKYYNMLAYVIYAVTIVLLIVTPLLGHNTKGTQSFIDIGPVKIQPAELFAKISVALALARYMSRYGYSVRSFKDLLVPFALVGVPMAIIMVWQDETGSALVLASFVLMFYREGMNATILLLGAAAVALFVFIIAWEVIPLPLGTGSVGMLVCMLLISVVQVVCAYRFQRRFREALYLTGGIAAAYAVALVLNIWVQVNFDYVSIAVVVLSCGYLAYLAISTRKRNYWFVVLFSLLSIGYVFSCDYLYNHTLKDHQQKRIAVLLGRTEDPKGIGYNVNQAKIAIGSGGLWGKGYLNGTQTKLKYVPEQDTDFIFCTVGEEFGFVGTASVLLLFLWFLLRLIKMAERQRDAFNRIFGYCVAGIFFFHVLINIGMVIGLLPVIGIPLPFFSYGGSQLWGFTILLFILIRLDASRMENY